LSIRILLADDHKIFREGLRGLLTGKPDIEVIGEAEDGRAVMQRVREVMPDVIVMDITMPGLNGIEATHQITAEFLNIKVIALSMHSDYRLVNGMLIAGASGYLLKDCAFEELEKAIRTVVADDVYLSPKIAKIVIDHHVRHSSATKSWVFSALSPREREILQLLAEGKNMKQIAFSLGVGIKTVETHRRRLMKKLHITSIAELTKYAIREGLTGLED
jgi:DNA-binding NarL/FixJ family response regulator